jgi:hypothetical protein
VVASCALLVAFVTVVALGRALDAAAIASPPVALAIMPKVLKTLGLVRSSPDGSRILLVGNSTAISRKPRRSLHRRLDVALDARIPHRDGGVEALIYPGLGPADYYGLADEIASAQPRLVIFTLSLGVFSPNRHPAGGRPELMGWIAPRRLPETLTLPLRVLGLTADQLLLQVGIVRAGAFDLWRTVRTQQAKVGRAWQTLHDRLPPDEASGPTAELRRLLAVRKLERWTLGEFERMSREGAERFLGAALDGVSRDHPILRVLGATLKRLSRSGIGTLVYVAPVDVEHLEVLGIDTATHLPDTIEAVADVVRGSGGEFADLHRLLPDDRFSDPNHFDNPGQPHGISELAEALAPHVLHALEAGGPVR